VYRFFGSFGTQFPKTPKYTTKNLQTIIKYPLSEVHGISQGFLLFFAILCAVSHIYIVFYIRRLSKIDQKRLGQSAAITTH